jgi:transcription elongation factor GreB
MSKAFVAESEEADADAESAESAALPVGTQNYMTPAGYTRLQAELAYLVKTERPRVVSVVSWAAGNGDRSENGDYIYGKKRLREIDRRIRYLTKRIENAVVVDPAQQENVEQVFFGATVTILDGEGVEASYQIVGIDEADATQGRISWLSPLARALMKAREGDQVRFHSPAGWRLLEVVAIRYGDA